MQYLKNLCALLVLTLLFSACSKDDGGSPAKADYYLRAKFNGEEKTFNHTLKFQGGGNDGRMEHIVVGGYEKSFPSDGSLPSPSYDFELWRIGGNITAGTYETQTEQEMISRYAIQRGASGTLIYNTQDDRDNYQLKIEHISEKEGIKGTFEGTIRSMEDGSVIVITDGEFNMPYEQLINP